MVRKSPPPEGNPGALPPSPAGRDDGVALWRQIAGTVRPLKRRGHTEPPRGPQETAPRPSGTGGGKGPPAGKRRPAGPQTPPQSALVAGAAPGLDKRTAARLRRGQIGIDGRIDLHGMTQEEAHANLSNFIKSSARAGRRCVLVITGKGIGKGVGGGILRAQLPHWLNGADLRPLILAFASARPRDGGGGAFYVYLRKRRDP